MYEFIVREYVNRLTDQDIKNYALSHGFELTDEEITILYKTAKEHWRIFLKGDPTPILNKLQTELQPNVFEALVTLYYETKKKFLK